MNGCISVAAGRTWKWSNGDKEGSRRMDMVDQEENLLVVLLMGH